MTPKEGRASWLSLVFFFFLAYLLFFFLLKYNFKNFSPRKKNFKNFFFFFRYNLTFIQLDFYKKKKIYQTKFFCLEWNIFFSFTILQFFFAWNEKKIFRPGAWTRLLKVGHNPFLAFTLTLLPINFSWYTWED